MKKYFSCVYAIFLLGCSAADPKITMEPPAYVEEMPSKITNTGKNNPGSLFGKGDSPLFADRKAMNINDIVTVVISETTNQKSQASKTTAENSKLNLGAGSFTGTQGTPLASVGDKLNQIAGIGFSGGNDNKYAGSGSNSRQETFNTTISARIVKVLANGNYFIEGSKELLLNNEKQIMQISGVIRPYDISQDNVIDSRHVSDAKIMYKTEGDLDRTTQKPWGTRLLESIWPF